jgi:hypothetical protein
MSFPLEIHCFLNNLTNVQKKDDEKQENYSHGVFFQHLHFIYFLLFFFVYLKFGGVVYFYLF